MSEKLTDPKERRWAWLHTAFALAFVLFYVYCPVNKYLWETVRTTYVAQAIPLAVGFYYFFRGTQGGVEQRLLICYALWLYISRILNGQLWLQEETELRAVVEMAVCSVLLPVGGLLNGRGRERLMNWISTGLALFFLPLGLIGVYAYLNRVAVYNPITGATLAAATGSSFGAINLADNNTNIGSFLYFVMFFLMVYQFFTCRRKLWRVPIVLTAAVSYLMMVFTFSRNTMITFSVCMAMLVILLLRRRFPGARLWVQALTVVLVLAVVVPLGIGSFRLTASAASRLIYENVYAQGEQGETPPAASGEPAVPAVSEDSFEDPRDLGKSFSTLSGRLAIFKGGFVTLAADPVRILRGSTFEHLMDITNKFTAPHSHVHMHNYLLQTLELTGLPGLLLVLLFSVLLALRMLRVFFAPDPRICLPARLLTLPVTGYLLYGMLEIPMFGLSDERSFLFFLLAGLFLAWSNELYPPEAEPYALKLSLKRRPDHGKG